MYIRTYLDWDTHLAIGYFSGGPVITSTESNKQTNKHTTLLIVIINCQMFNHAIFCSFGGCSGHSSLFCLGGGRGVQRKKARNTITGIGP